MSDHWIGIIPKNPKFVPSESAIAQAEAFMKQIAPEAEEISSEVSNRIRFRDCGANLESIRCPVCNAELSMDWWSEQMGDEDGWNEKFELPSLHLPCGHHVEALNDLSYYFDQGFSRYLLDTMNPNVGRLEDGQIKRFEEILGCKVKIIYQHI